MKKGSPGASRGKAAGRSSISTASSEFAARLRRPSRDVQTSVWRFVKTWRGVASPANSHRSLVSRLAQPKMATGDQRLSAVAESNFATKKFHSELNSAHDFKARPVTYMALVTASLRAPMMTARIFVQAPMGKSLKDASMYSCILKQSFCLKQDSKNRKLSCVP